MSKENQTFQVGDRVRFIPPGSRDLFGEFGTVQGPYCPGVGAWYVRPENWPVALVFHACELENLSSASKASKEGENDE